MTPEDRLWRDRFVAEVEDRLAENHHPGMIHASLGALLSTKNLLRARTLLPLVLGERGFWVLDHQGQRLTWRVSSRHLPQDTVCLAGGTLLKYVYLTVLPDPAHEVYVRLRRDGMSLRDASNATELLLLP